MVTQHSYPDRAFDFLSLGKLLVKACARARTGQDAHGPIEAIGFMLLGTEPSQFRVEKTKTDAVILLSDGETVRDYFFVAHASPRSNGPELVGELLNAETGFFPFELHDDDSGPQTVVYNRVYRPEGRDRLSDWARQAEVRRGVFESRRQNGFRSTAETRRSRCPSASPAGGSLTT